MDGMETTLFLDGHPSFLAIMIRMIAVIFCFNREWTRMNANPFCDSTRFLTISNLCNEIS